jgi:hypothetical protein
MEAAFRRAEEKERQEIKEADEHREPNPWLRRVGWAAHLAGLDRGEIREWVEMPNPTLRCKSSLPPIRRSTRVRWSL